MKLDLKNINVTQVNSWFAAQKDKDPRVIDAVRETLLQANYRVIKLDDGTFKLLPLEEKNVPPSKREQNDTPSGNMDNIIDILTQLIATSGGVDEKEVNNLIRRYLSTNKIGVSDLDDELLKMMDKEPQKFTVILPDNWKQGEKTGDIPEFPQPITDIIISDLHSRLPNNPKGGGNNVFLYGGAGTGKTYIFKAIAKHILNVEIITINCNQFTSPTELVGGQTIEGYQQGRLIEAYASLNVPDSKNGYLVLLDELPKLDPNTAGVLNDLLSSIRDGSNISDGRLQQWARGDKQLYIVATGNTKLNRADPEYEANQRQDMSLVDRFTGSMYKFVVELGSEKDMMAEFHCLWIFNYLVELRFFLQERDYTNFGFVSRRLMQSMVGTVAYYFAMKEKGLQEEAKTPQIGLEVFLHLFDPDQISDIKKNTKYDLFMEKCKLHLENDKGNHPENYRDEVKLAGELVEKYMAEQKKVVAYMNRYGKA